MTAVDSSLAYALRDRYVLQRELGRGGMATVYLAHDLKHDREVALKVLRPELAAVLGRERFLAEIHLTAKLDHPHILTLIDSGESDGFLWYVVPFIRGESLRQKLEREKQLGVDEALGITKQVVGALEYAHQHGVIHRDLKPENILLHEGEAMLADFGIALAVKEAGGNRLTETGLSLGTPQYMSPEQATGDRQLDARSDVYSLAAVLYEMLAGEPPHTGATVQAVIVKLMTERPTRLRTIRDTVPEGVDAAIAKALSKVPVDRYASAGQFNEALQAGAATRTATPAAPSRVPWRLGVLAVVIAAVAVVVTIGRGKGAAGAPAQYALDRQVTFSGDVGSIALAPDGRTVVYATQDRSSLVLQDLDGGGSRTIYSAPEGAVLSQVYWSPDGARILFRLERAGLQLLSIPKLGGEARLEMDLSHLARLNGLHLTPTPGGEWILISESRFYLGSDPASLRQEGGRLAGAGVFSISGLAASRWAVTSPDGAWVAIAGLDTSFAWSSSIMSRDGKAGPGRVPEWSGLRALSWTPDGAGLYLLREAGNGWDLLRAPIDRRTGHPTGPPALVYPRLQDVAQIRLSTDGRRLVFVSGPTSTRIRVIELDGTPDPSGNPQSVLSQGTAVWTFPAFLPDGRIAVASLVQDGYDILALSRTGAAPQLLAQRRGMGQPANSKLNPSPDSRTFALVEVGPQSGLSSALTLLTVPTGRAQVIPLPERANEVSWSADGRYLGGMTASSPNRVLTVDVTTGTARSVELQCGDRCEFAWETIVVGPNWPFAAVSSQIDLWIANLETGALRLLAANSWVAEAWLGDWVYFTKLAGQTEQRRLTLFRVRSSGGKEERLLDLPAECIDRVTVSRDGKTVACAEVTVRQDIRVIDNFDPAVGRR